MFYPAPATLHDTWLGYGAFLMPYALVPGTIGGYVGMCFAREEPARRRFGQALAKVANAPASEQDRR